MERICGTGYDGFNYLKDFYEYDPTGNAWARRPIFLAHQDMRQLVWYWHGYLGTGFDGSNASKIFKYDPHDTWSDIGLWQQEI
jgi:hypothetical protein